MTDEKLLRAIGDIDDRFVEEADMASVSLPGSAFSVNTKTAGDRPVRRRRWLKVAAGACAAVLLFTAGFFGGAGGFGGRSYSGKNNVSPSYSEYEPSDAGNDVIRDLHNDGQYSAAPSDTTYEGSYKTADGDRGLNVNTAPSASGGDGQTTTTGSPLKNTKLVWSATMSLQTTEFEKTCGFIKELADKYFAYIENETVDNGNGSATYRRSASYTVRVPAENYNSFLSGMNDGCYVVSLNQKMSDVSEQYFNIEQKLETLRNKHDRLEELLKQADKMEDILTIEEALSENEYQINQYQSSLNKYDSLVNYSTVKISLKEVSRPDTTIGEDPGFFQKLGKSFAEGFANAGMFFENLAYWISYHIIGLIVFAAIVIAIVKIHPVRKIKAARAKKNG